MINVIAELSKYVILTLMIVYTLFCLFTVIRGEDEEKRLHLGQQVCLIFLLNLTAFFVIYLKSRDFMVLIYFAETIVYYVIIQIMYRIFYEKASFLLLNNMCMLLSVGFIMLCRLDMQAAQKQMVIVGSSSFLSLLIPIMIRKMRFLRKLTWIYAGMGIVLLGAVFVLARTSYGAKLTLMGIQPSEAIKITFVFFMAALFQNRITFRKVIEASVVAGIHIGILVLSRDLGSAVIFFVVYLIMLYTATRKKLYLLLGIAGGSMASVVAYKLFGHVRQRVSAWRNPMAVYENEGYQIVQSLFAIGTGGWFGMGLCQGSPENIPVVKNDFIFSAICEELGGIFAICLILICMSFFLLILNISRKITNPFYKLIALGLGTEYAFQVFLTIGGATKFIPMTGVTLPLVSYGGSSVVSTILMLSIIQGLYILREDEDVEIERQRRELAKRAGEKEEMYGR
ncbi:MAG: FtsW/RodA/SpoVE family cell cycle protein [Blautia sp.]|nr:FtsW/RodA/SpoVE family cell cycle protein [Blautia sp.]